MSECICTEILNGELDAVVNPDCPLHGAMNANYRRLYFKNKQSEIVKRIEQIWNEFDARMELVGWVIARLELAKALAETESKLFFK